jgi:hypothetical protein
MELTVNERANRRIPEVVDVETRQLKSDTQIKREWEELVSRHHKERDEDIRLSCVSLIFREGPETYKKGDTLYELAERLFIYVKSGKYKR